MSGTNIQNFLSTFWEFTGGKQDKDNFIQKALKVCKVSKVTAYNLFWKDIRKIKKDLQGIPVSKASAIISKEWKKS